MIGKSGGSSGDTANMTGDTVLFLRRCRTLILIGFNVFMIVSIARIWQTIVGEGEVKDKEVSYKRPDNAPLVAIVSCIKSGVYQPAWFLEQKLLPSIYATITDKERTQYRVELFLGYDVGDAYWQGHNHQLSPKAKYSEETIYGDREPIPVNFVSIKKDPSGERPNRIPFNELCQAAYDYGAIYIVRINDDSEFLSSGWISVATKVLGSFIPPNIGVVGPTCNQGDTTIMTHDMVHAPSHYSIFDTYYPAIFDNYYVDDWMTHVYGEERTKQLEDFEVEHHLTTFWTRYQPTFAQDQLLNQTIKEGRELVEKAVLQRRDAGTNDNVELRQRDELRVLGTDTIERVDGPMQELHLALKKSSN